MTIRELSAQIHSLATGHRINGEARSKQWLEHYIRKMFSTGSKLHNKIVMEIQLPDGNWLMTINRYADMTDGFDYTIPDNREQERRIWNELTA